MVSDALITVVMTTAPRAESTIEKSINSITRAGFPGPLVFAEPESYIPRQTPSIQHDEKQGVWHNWLAAARHAVHCETPYVMTCQDDIDIHPDAYEFLRELLPFKDHVGCVSLYTSHVYGATPGIRKIATTGFWGSLCLVFRTPVLKLLLNHRLVNTWRGLNYSGRKQDIIDDDMAIGRIVKAAGLGLYCVAPSPVIHTGVVSSIHKPHAKRQHRNTVVASDFDEPLAKQIPKPWSDVSLIAE